MSLAPQKLSVPARAPSLFLAPRPDGRPRTLLERLAMLYRLYSYGRANISNIVRIETERAALALSVVFLFDLFAWSLVWNAVFHRGVFAFTFKTCLAILMGLIFALIVLSFEQGFITMDGTGPLVERRRNWGAAGLRIVAVIASAYVTAQPLELLVFANDIDKRVHEERVWETIISETLNYTQLKNEINSGNVEAQTANVRTQAAPDQPAAVNTGQAAEQPSPVNSSAAGPSGAGQPAENITDLQRAVRERNQKKQAEQKARDDLNEAKAALKEHQDQLEGLRKSLRKAAQEAKRKKDDLDKAKSAPESPAAIADAEEAYKKAVGQVSAINASITRTEGAARSDEHRVNVRAPAVDDAHRDVQDADKAVNDRRQELNHKLEALQKWVTRLANSLPSEKEFPQEDDKSKPSENEFLQAGYKFKQLPYSFNEQRRVLDDIRYARPIQRHNLLSIQDKNVLSRDLQIGDPKEIDINTQAEREASAVTARWLYWSFFVAALFVPSMGLIFKMTIHRQLKQYYSLIWQASVGHPEAMQAIQEPRSPSNPGRR